MHLESVGKRCCVDLYFSSKNLPFEVHIQIFVTLQCAHTVYFNIYVTLTQDFNANCREDAASHNFMAYPW